MTIDPDILIDAADEAGMDTDAVRTSYSGRGMYGDSCVGVVGSPGELAAFVAALAVTLADRGEDTGWLGNLRQDSMGLSTIWYWPGVTAEEAS